MAIRSLALLPLLALPATSPLTVAADTACVQLKTSTEVRRVDSDSQGREMLKLEPVEQLSAGDEVIHTLAAANVCKEAVIQPVITYAVPKHMTYVPSSAIGPAAQVSFSVDGGFHFNTPERLEVEAAGERRQAKPQEYTHIRWAMSRPLAPQAVALVRFRTVVK